MQESANWLTAVRISDREHILTDPKSHEIIHEYCIFIKHFKKKKVFTIPVHVTAENTVRVMVNYSI